MESSHLNKRIAIVGAGAIGSFYGYFMAKAGYDVTLVARGAHLEAMQESGKVKLDSRIHGSGEASVNAKGFLEGEYDCIIISVKSQDTEVACEMAKGHLKNSGYAISFQNGIENAEILERHFGADSTLGASLYIGVWIETPGTVNHSAYGDVTFGAPNARAKTHANDFASILENSGLKFTQTDNIRYVLWKKLVWNVAYNPLSALLESKCGRMAKNADTYSLMVNMVLETLEAAKLEGIEIPEDDWRPLIAYKDSLNDYKTSMLVDIQKGRNPEIDGILLPVIKKLEVAGKKAPYCETVYKSLKFKYGDKFVYTPRIAADVIVRKGDSILLIERGNEPYGWAIPGGFVDYGERVEDAARRELLEETGLESPEVHFLGIYSDPERDKRGHVASAVYYADIPDAAPVAGDDAKNARFWKLDELPAELAFDHAKVIQDYIERTGG
ncbi:2-dehydropantoate 2-reductase [Limisalsivibrio acetivorans]|uniref:2-dehydropantoate 2-reductase n=1 Tax=Limisalsivibrio acetivorans TaxID=1304888 RepID=UPI0003B596AC|nr:2-dehydropantoate 2-reductase [Limisalsivibrio acetivorans]